MPDFVDCARLGGIAICNHKRRHVLHHFRAAADHRQFSDMAKLMDRRQPADDRMVFNRDMTRKRRDI